MPVPILSVDRLVKRFGTRLAIDGVSFDVQSGEAVGLLGPNGAGKTTTLSIITGLLRSDSGEVRIAGIRFASDTDPRKRQFGLVPQDLALYDEAEAAENLRFFAALYGMSGRARDRAIDGALDFVGLRDRASERVRTFSGGMKRRLNLAAALMHDPDLLLLDEPTVGVDPQSRNAIFENIATLRSRGKTIVYTTHYMEEVERLCDRVIILDHGRVVTDEPLSALRQRSVRANHLRVEVRGSDSTDWLPDLRAVKGVESVEWRGCELHLVLVDLRRHTGPVLDFLAQRGVEVAGFQTDRPSLESVFLELTGHTLRD